MGDRTTRPIERVRTGDLVLATDPRTGETGPRRVKATIYTPDDRDFTSITLDRNSGGGSLTATSHHPFWNENGKSWKDAADLTPRDTLRTPGGATAQINSVRHWTGLAPAYNLSVNSLHTYYVLAGRTPILVHNSGCKLNMTPIGNGSMLSPAGLVYGAGSRDGHRLRHGLQHGTRGKTNASKTTNSQFNSYGRDLLLTVDEAWRRRGTPMPSGAGRQEYIIPMGRDIGTMGQQNIKIVVEEGSSRIITAHPV
ncbi:polymorphic toxin-type HINT domain-containing protein [Streptomyces sp. NPDC056437]|uniref:polymorphic toxin-type HINT domain-containing protein n=1 Tax=Streptomyces sp. NPDC056437 TaxID=3345816 RepID=UPI0036A0FF84